MSEQTGHLDLANSDSVAQQRNLVVAGLRDILLVAGATDQADLLRRGKHAEVVNWFTGDVSVGAHGINAGDFGLTPQQTRDFNPLAQRYQLMNPDLRLYVAGDDDMPEGAQPGDIADYEVVPDLSRLDPAVRQASETFCVDATFDGSVGRIITAMKLASNTIVAASGKPAELTIITGMRAVKSAEGASGLYKKYLPKVADPSTPIELAFPAMVDGVEAILDTECDSFIKIAEIDDPDAGRKPEERRHPLLGGRTWIERRYLGEYEGRLLSITVVNGEPIKPSGDELNRSKKEPAPVAALTLIDHLSLTPSDRLLRPRNGVISFAHLRRIMLELATKSRADFGQALGATALVGNMPQKATWERVNANGHQNGGTLGIKEVWPLIKAYNENLGRPIGDLSVDEK